jgi:drug/metabolite transporter (DMT)-like permease
MTTFAHDEVTVRPSRLASGLGLAVISATAFGLSGSLAKGLLDAGWTAGSAVTARILIAAAALFIPAVLSLRGRWHLVRDNIGLLVSYGVVAVAGCQLAYFNAVDHMQVGVALMIEYTAPVSVIGWLWLRHGQRPGLLTVLGAMVAAVGLVLVLDLVSGADLSVVGVVWALAAMAGAAAYFVMSADEDNGLPPLVLAAGGLLSGGAMLLVAALVGIVPFAAPRTTVTFVDTSVSWWVPVLALGLVTAALAYVAGIAASRRLGSRLASFVALTEVLAALIFAWLLLDELPGGIQVVGGALILLGVVVVKLGEPEAPLR